MNGSNSRRAARLASVLVVIFLLGGSTAFAYASRVPGTGLQPAGAGHLTHPADDSGDSTTSVNSTATHSSENETHSSTVTGSVNETSSETAVTTHNDTETTTCSATGDSSQTQNGTQSTSTVSCSEHTTLNETETHSTTESHNETSSVTHTETEQHTENGTSTRTESVNSTRTGENETSTLEQNQTQSREFQFHLVSPTTNQTGYGEAGLQGNGLIVNLQAQVQRMNASTQYTLAISVNGTDHALGTLVTDGEGEGGIHAQFNATAAGTYSIGVSLLQGSTVALKSEPSTITIFLVQNGTASAVRTDHGEHVNTVQGSQQHEQEIKNAEKNNSIPAVVQVGASGASASVLDSKFSVSVGQLAGNGVAIQITGTNVTGPRVLLVNLTNSATIATGSLSVTLDGTPVTQAASLAQVLNPAVGDPARYIVVSTSTGLQLLVSIPHFSTHVIEILPVLAQAVGSFLSVDGPVLALSLLMVTVLFAAVYARRPRIRL